MRQQYTPIFRNHLSSRTWAMPPEARCVWLYLQLAADPEGFVSTDMAGVALGANVPLPAAREAMAAFEAPDPDADPGDPQEGRVVARVKGGWLVIEFEAQRERAKTEAEKARKRRSMQRARAIAKAAAQAVHNPVENAPDAPPANDTSTHTEPATVTERDESELAVAENDVGVDQPKPTPKPKPKPINSSEGVGSPLPPIRDVRDTDPTWRDPPGLFDAPVVPAVLHRIPDSWAPSQALRDDARIAGVHRFDEHIARLRLGPIGGNRGVFPDQLDNWIRSLFGKMRTWDEIERAKNPPGAKPVANPGLPPSVPGAPAWVLVTHQQFCMQHRLKLGEQARAFASSSERPNAEGFTHWLLANAATEAA